MLPFRPSFKAFQNILHKNRKIFRGLFHLDNSCVQPGQFQQGVNHIFHPLDLSLRFFGEAAHGCGIIFMALYNLMVHFQGRQRCFNLMGYIRNNVLQKFFGLPLILGMSREDRRHFIDGMKKAVPVTSL